MFEQLDSEDHMDVIVCAKCEVAMFAAMTHTSMLVLICPKCAMSADLLEGLLHGTPEEVLEDVREHITFKHTSIENMIQNFKAAKAMHELLKSISPSKYKQ